MDLMRSELRGRFESGKYSRWFDGARSPLAIAVFTAVGEFSRLYAAHVKEVGSLPAISFEPGLEANPRLKWALPTVAEKTGAVMARGTEPTQPAFSAAVRAQLSTESVDCAWAEKLETQELEAIIWQAGDFLARFPSPGDGYAWPRFDTTPERDAGLRAAVHRLVAASRMSRR